MAKKKKKNKEKKQSQIEKPLAEQTNDNILESNETTLINDNVLVDHYFEYLNNKLNDLNNELVIKNNEKTEIELYLEQNHKLYEKIKDNSFEIQKSIVDYPKIEQSDTNEQCEYLIFDFENNCYKSSSMKKMPICYLGDAAEIHLCKENGIYVGKNHYSSSRLFLTEKDKINNDINYISSFDKIIDDVIGKNEFESKFSLFGMLPEMIDVFNTRIRRCLNTSKGKIISIPKSVAVTYCLLDQLQIGDRYCVVDLDGYSPVITQLSIGKDKNGKKVILREGFIKKHSIKYNYIFFVKKYIKEFENKYSISLSENEKQSLVYDKVIDEVLIRKDTVSFFRKNGRINIIYDEDIFQSCYIEYLSLECQFPNCSKVFIISEYPDLVMGNNIIQCNNMTAFLGMEVIRDILKNDENAIIWKERLPKVSLEVIDDVTGRFKVINLIDENNEGQNIRLSIDEEVELPFKGTITLQKGKKDYYLPLEREVFAEDINSAKEAYFNDKSFPLSKNVPVELVVKYNYLSESPIKIYAKPKIKIDEFQEISNSWIDSHEIKLYSGPIYDGHEKNIDTPNNDVFISSKNGLFNFVNKTIDLNQNEFKPDKTGFYIHKSIFKLSSSYYFLRSTFDSENIMTSIFSSYYNNCNLNSFFEYANKALELPNSKYENYLRSQVERYKQGLLRLMSEIIVASWYYNVDDENINSIYQKIVEENKIKLLIRLSRCILSNKEDKYDVFNKLTEKLYNYFTEKYKKDKYDERNQYIRSLSQNCWFNKNWLYQFYNTPNGPATIKLMTEYITNYLQKNKFKTDKEYRDILEFLVCLTMAKNYDNNLFNPNNEKTKILLKYIKDSYETALKNIGREKLVSRLEIQQDQGALHGYPNYIFILIMILSGEGQVNLVGYKDE